jgi:uncharacterized protein (TIGR03083 family)
MTDFPALYRETRERLGARVAGLDECPGWDVRAVLSHLTGIVADLQDGRLDGVGTDEWTAAQVSARRDLPMAVIVDEWNEKAPALEDQLATWPEDVAGQLVSDATSHELDVRGALGDHDARDTEGIRYTFERYAGRLGTRVTEAGLPAVRIVGGDQTVVAGDGDAEVTVRGPAFELVRALAGRRSAAQIRALDWDGDCGPYLPVFSGYGAREADLVE